MQELQAITKTCVHVGICCFQLRLTQTKDNRHSRHSLISWDKGSAFFDRILTFLRAAFGVAQQTNHCITLSSALVKDKYGMWNEGLHALFVVFRHLPAFVTPWTTWCQPMRSPASCAQLPKLIHVGFLSLLQTSMERNVGRPTTWCHVSSSPYKMSFGIRPH